MYIGELLILFTRIVTGGILIFIIFDKTFYNKYFLGIILPVFLTGAANAQPDLNSVTRNDLEQRRALEREQAQRDVLQKTPDAIQPAGPVANLPWPEGRCCTNLV